MSSFLGDRLKLADAKVGKNYLHAEELKLLRLVADAFLIYAESKALRGKSLTMAGLLAKMDKLLEFNELPVFPGYGDGYLRPKADAHAREQYDLFRARTDQRRLDQARLP